MWNFVLEIILAFGVPWLFGKVVGYIFRRRNNQAKPSTYKPKIQPSKYSKLLSLFLFGLFLFYTQQAAFNHPPDFFKTVGSPYDAPNYLLRNKFREYVAIQRAIDDQFEVPQQSISLACGSEKILGDFDDHGDNSSEGRKGYSRYDYLFGLFELLKINSNRNIYLAFGEESFARCDWCRESFDYAAYSFAGITLPYIIFGFILMIVSSFRQFKAHFTWTISIVFSFYMVEIMTRLTPHDVLKELQISPTATPFFFYFHVGRNVVFALVCFLLWIRRNSQEMTKEDKFKYIIECEKGFLGRLNAVGMQSIAVMEDSELFNEFKTYHERNTVGSLLRNHQAMPKSKN